MAAPRQRPTQADSLRRNSFQLRFTARLGRVTYADVPIAFNFKVVHNRGSSADDARCVRLYELSTSQPCHSFRLVSTWRGKSIAASGWIGVGMRD